MRDVALTVYSLLVMWAIGLLLIRRFRWFQRHFPSVVYGAALGIGGGLLSLVLLLSSGLTGRLRPIWGYVLLAGATALGWRLVPGARSVASPGPAEGRTGFAEICLVAALVSTGVAMLVSGSFGTLLGDGRAIWAFKAKVFFLNQDIDVAVLADETRFGFTHPDYPLLVPLLEWWVYAHLGHVNDSAVRLLHVAFYLSLLAAFYGSLRAYVRRTPALLCTVALSLLAPAVINTLAGYADLILAYYALLGFVSFVEWVNTPHPDTLASAAISLALGTHVKSEGLAWLVAVAAPLGVAVWRARKRSSGEHTGFGAFLAISGAVAAVWPLYRWVFGIPVSPVVSRSALNLVGRRLSAILWALLAEFGDLRLWPEGWGLLWPFALLGGLRALLCASPWRRSVLSRWSPLLIQFALVCGVYLLTAAPLRWHLETSLSRILLQIAPCCLWAGAVTLVPVEPFQRGSTG